MPRRPTTSPSPDPATRGDTPRVVKAADERRAEILDTAERLFYERGYERTPVRAIIDAIGIAKGTFYHHFPSKTELLDALVTRLSERALEIALPALSDESLSAPEKFRAMFGNVSAWKLKNKALLIRLMRALYSEENAAMRRRSQQASLRLFAPLMERIIAQGIAEGHFQCQNPDIVVRLLFSMATDMGELIAGMMLQDEPVVRAELRRQVGGYNDAMNRLLGAPAGTIELFRWELIEPWFTFTEEDA